MIRFPSRGREAPGVEEGVEEERPRVRASYVPPSRGSLSDMEMERIMLGGADP